MHDYVTETGKSALFWRPGPVSEGILPGTAAQAALFLFWFVYFVFFQPLWQFIGGFKISGL